MKKKLPMILCGLLFLVGLAVILYPTISDQWNAYRQSFLIADYERAVAELPEENFDEEWKKARDYNEAFGLNDIYSDAFGTGDVDIKDSEYWKVLNITGDGTMGYLEIPKINVKLSINHGTAEETLQTSIGHLSGSKLPIGGESNHTVLAAHRGLPSAKLFTDIDKLVEGDVFYLNILGEIMAYEVDQILPMVDKDDSATLEPALQVEEGEDYVTLFTCTPYGVNTHRLLVRGSRIPYEPEPEPETIIAPVEEVVESVQNYYLLYAIVGLCVVVIMVTFISLLYKPGKRKKK